MMHAGWQIPNWGSADQWVRAEAAPRPPGIQDTLRELLALAAVLPSETSGAGRERAPARARCAARRRELNTRPGRVWPAG
jgi:hypothetical protein